MCAGVAVHPDAALSKGEPEGLDVSAQLPGAAGAQPVSGYLPPNSRSSGFPAQQRAHAQGPQGEHALSPKQTYLNRYLKGSGGAEETGCTERAHHCEFLMVGGSSTNVHIKVNQSKHRISSDLINEVKSAAVDIANTSLSLCKNQCARESVPAELLPGSRERSRTRILL